MNDQYGFWEIPEASTADPGRSISEVLASFVWSYSRRSTFEQCVRRYYYEYFGANRRTAKQDSDKGILHTLKAIPTRHERAGYILHLVIGTYLKKCQEGDTWSDDRLVRWASDMFHRDIEYSQSDPTGATPATIKFPPVLLHEFYYRRHDALEQCMDTKSRLVQAITAFTADDRYAEFRRAGATPGSWVEKPFKIRNVAPCRIEGKIDLAYFRESIATVVDWKLGLEDGVGDESLQLATYALWAIEFFGCSADSVRVCKVHFGSRTVAEFQFNENIRADARARILQDAERMVSLTEYGQNSIVQAFSPCVQPRICAGCSFLKACREGAEVVDD